MSTLYRLKAYFGMVPPEDMEAYADAYGYGGEYEGQDQHYPDQHYRDQHYRDRRRDQCQDQYDDERGEPEEARPARGAAAVEQVPDQRRPKDDAGAWTRHDVRDRSGSGSSGTVGLTGSGHSGRRNPPVHGSLAVDPDSAPMASALPAPLAAPSPEPASRLAGSPVLSRITTVHPRSYNEARTIGERYRDGTPVIINLTELDDAAAKRLVDFAAGLAFALRGSIDKVTSRVFLLSPAGADVSAEERRRLAEGGLFGQG